MRSSSLVRGSGTKLADNGTPLPTARSVNKLVPWVVIGQRVLLSLTQTLIPYMSRLLQISRVYLRPVSSRCFATAHVNDPSSKAKFRESLEHGPTLDDFVSGESEPLERVVLGNAKGYGMDLLVCTNTLTFEPQASTTGLLENINTIRAIIQ